MAKGHALLVPKATGYASVIDMPPDVAAEVLRELPRLAKCVKDATGCDGGVTNGRRACTAHTVLESNTMRTHPTTVVVSKRPPVSTVET